MKEILLKDSPVVVLGMHRSGTSALTGLLEDAGLNIGQVVRKSPANPKGNLENPEIWQLNDALLKLNGASWKSPPKTQLHWTDDLRRTRDHILTNYDTTTAWGFKDPRMVFTLPFWQEALPRMRLVGSFRHPGAVAASLARRNGFDAARSIALWTAYNRQLLHIHRTQPFPMTCFDDPPAPYLDDIAQACGILGLRQFGTDAKARFFDDALRTTEIVPVFLPEETTRVYAALLDARNQTQDPRPELSIIVNFHNMQREAERTLFSLCPAFQQDVTDDSYEVIAVDNGSSRPLDADHVTAFGPNFRYHFLETNSPSPVGAVNFAIRRARGRNVAVIVDGARMASPRLVARCLQALRSCGNAYVVAPSFHIGPKIQRVSVSEGYDRDAEDALLANCEWQQDGYRLFDVSVLSPASREGYLGDLPHEASFFAIPRQAMLRLGGFDMRFQSPGGGLCNQEFRNRTINSALLKPMMLLGEAVFHQVHGGSTTGKSRENRPIADFLQEFETLFGGPPQRAVAPRPILIGDFGPRISRFLGLPDSIGMAMPALTLLGSLPAPFAIGGLGGSGTRIFAELCRAAGLDLRGDMNPQLDALWFSALLVRAQWKSTTPPAQEIATARDLFLRAMTQGLAGTVSKDERALLTAIRDDLPPRGSWINGARAGTIRRVLNSGQAPAGPWGWKEPNTHVFLPDFDRAIPGFRYLHVLRDPLDMVCSSNLRQMQRWSVYFGLPKPRKVMRQECQLRYWIVANRAALDYGRRYMKGRFAAVQYEAMCAAPDQTWDRLSPFLSDLPHRDMVDPGQFIKPTTIGRSKDADLSRLSADDIATARALYHEIDGVLLA